MTPEDAWKTLLEEFGANKALNLITPLRDKWAKELPDIKTDRWKGQINYQSTIEGFPSWNFGTELEAHLANAIFLIYQSSGKEFREEKMKIIFQMTLTLLDIESEWRF